MAEELKITRPFRERFLDGFDRSQLRAEVEKVKPRRFRKLRNKYVTYALGASLAMGGIGAPLKMMHDSHKNRVENAGGPQNEPAAGAIDQAISGDLKAAQNIASQVAGGVGVVAKGVEQGVQQAAQTPLAAVAG